MKSLFLAAAMLLTAIAMSQTSTVVDSGGDYDSQIQSTFQFVSTAGATTGKLIERAPRLINIEDYNGSRLADSLTMNFNKYMAMYIMGSAASYTGSSGLPDPDLVYNNRATINGAQVIYLLAQRYNQFDPAAAARGQIRQFGNGLSTLTSLFGNGLFASTNLYLEDTLFAAAIQDTVFQTGTTSFILPASAIVSNWGTAPLQNISIDWGDGLGSQPYTVGQTTSVNYSTAGTKKVILSYTLSNGKILRTQFSVQVTGLLNSVLGPNAPLLGLRYQKDAAHYITIPVTASKSYLGLVNSVDIDVFFACDDKKIRKPLILLDGFEPMDHNSVNFQTILDAINFSATPNNNELGIDFRDAGYDLIFVDWNKNKTDQGRDYIQRNAYLLEAILQKVNDMKRANGSAEQNVVIGFSMGGVIGKYALLDMEKDNPTAANGGHDARLFIAYDAPLKGANISLGTQHFLRHFSEYHIGFTSLRHFDAKLQTSFDVIHSPAATQMLIYQANDPNPYAPAGHLNFQNELEHQGMNGDGALQKCVFKAITNGSVTGKQQFNAGDIMFYGKGSLLDLANFNPFITVAIDIYQNFNGFGSIDLYAFASIWSLPVQGGVGKIYDGFITSYTRVALISIPHQQHYSITVSDSKPLDTAPGGFTALGKKSIPSVFTSVNPLFCFIPAVSALEIKNQPFLDNLNLPISDISGVTTAGLTKVKSYDGARSGSQDIATGLNDSISGPDNQQHVSFSYRNTGFLLSELLPYNGLSSLPNGTLDNRTYNFGVNSNIYTAPSPGNLIPTNVSHTINYNLTIQNNGKLWVNRSGKINFTDQNNPVNTVNADYLLTVGGPGSGCTPTSGAVININNLGEMRIGQGAIPLNNTATVHIVQGGEIDVNKKGDLVVENNSTLEVDSGGVVNIKSEGFACAMWGAHIVIKNGGVVHLFAGDTLRISEYSALTVESGGKLIIDAGAMLQLWDGQAPNGQATVWVKAGGEMVVNGNFTFSGNGFFQFDYGHKLTLNSDWALNGYDKAHRLIQLNAPPQQSLRASNCLDISGHAFTLTNCLVASGGNTLIKVHNAPSFTATNVAFQGTVETIGLYSDNVALTQATGCDFTGLLTGAWITNSPNAYLISNCHFSNCVYGVTADHIGNDSQITNCLFDGNTNAYPNPTENVAISLSNMFTAYITNTTVTGDQPYGWGRPLTGVRLNNVDFPGMVGGVIKNCTYGVDGRNGANNFIIGKGGVISGCQTGVTMIGTGLFGKPYGAFLMLCGALKGNHTGVYGTDVLLSIDNTNIASGQFPNLFSNNSGDKLFDVCYVQRSDIQTVFARQNLWQWRNNLGCRSPAPSSDWNLQSGYSFLCHIFNNMTLDRSNVATQSTPQCDFGPLDCPSQLVDGGPTSLTSSPSSATGSAKFSAGSRRAAISPTSVMVDGVLIDLAPQYDSAKAALRAQNITLAQTLFLPIASIPDAARNPASSEARHMIDLARIFVSGRNMGSKKRQNNWVEGSVLSIINTDTGTGANLYPNPADQYFRIELSEGRHEIRAFNAVGALVRSVSADGSYEMDTRSWPSGLYTVEAVNTATHEKWRGKVMIQK